MWIAGLVIWSFCFAMGFNYGHSNLVGDSLWIIVILLIALLGLMSTTIFLLNKWANPNIDYDRKTSKIKEIFCLVAYVVLVILTISGVASFITVQTKVKTEVRSKGQSRLDDLERIFGSEDKESSYKSYVDDLIPKYRNVMKSDFPDSKTLEIRIAGFKDTLMGDGKYNGLRVQFDNLKKKRRYLDNWIPWEIMEYLRQLDEESLKYSNELVTLSLNSEYVKKIGEQYDPKVDFSESLFELVKNRQVSDFNLLTIIIVLVLQIMVLFPYLSGKDWSNSGPRKHKVVSGGPVVWEKPKQTTSRYNSNNNENEEIEEV